MVCSGLGWNQRFLRGWEVAGTRWSLRWGGMSGVLFWEDGGYYEREGDRAQNLVKYKKRFKIMPAPLLQLTCTFSSDSWTSPITYLDLSVESLRISDKHQYDF